MVDRGLNDTYNQLISPPRAYPGFVRTELFPTLPRAGPELNQNSAKSFFCPSVRPVGEVTTILYVYV
eukprot:scaffold37739_cov147-Skeletonema_marinoi.AAC.2